MDNLLKFLSRRNEVSVGILILAVFSMSGIQYLWQREVSVCKVLIPNKYSVGIQYLWQGEINVCKVLMPVKNDYFLHPKF